MTFIVSSLCLCSFKTLCVPLEAQFLCVVSLIGVRKTSADTVTCIWIGMSTAMEEDTMATL